MHGFRALGVVAGLLGALAPVDARALPAMAPPEVVVGAGSTFAADGEPGNGGAATSLEVLWPVARGWAFGGALFAQDLGTAFVDLHDPNTGAPLGTVASLHRWAFGGEWRASATLRETRRVRWLLGAGFGYGRQERDQRGTVDDAVSGVTASTGITFAWQSPRGQALAATLAWRQAFVGRETDAGRSTRWATAGLEWRWRGISKD